MPVYLLTAHAYRSWREDDPRGYVQHGEGLKSPDAERARWRERAAKQPPVRFELAAQAAMQGEVPVVTKAEHVTLYAVATCPTHVHTLVAFETPPCTCDGGRYCLAECPGRDRADNVMTRIKQCLGRRLALEANVRGRRWFSRGGDVTPVRNREHLRHLLSEYLPDHEVTQGGVCRAYPIPRKPGGTGM